MKGDSYLLAGAAAVPSLGGGMVAYQGGAELLGLAVGAPGAVFLVASFLAGGVIMADIARQQIASGLRNLYRGVHG